MHPSAALPGACFCISNGHGHGSNGDANRERKVIVVGGHRSIVVGRNLAHFTTFDAFEAAFAGFFAQEAAAQGGDTTTHTHNVLASALNAKWEKGRGREELTRL